MTSFRHPGCRKEHQELMAVVGQWGHSTFKWVRYPDVILQRKTTLSVPWPRIFLAMWKGPFLFYCYDNYFVPLGVRKNCHGSSCKYIHSFFLLSHMLGHRTQRRTWRRKSRRWRRRQKQKQRRKVQQIPEENDKNNPPGVDSSTFLVRAHS